MPSCLFGLFALIIFKLYRKSLIKTHKITKFTISFQIVERPKEILFWLFEDFLEDHVQSWLLKLQKSLGNIGNHFGKLSNWKNLQVWWIHRIMGIGRMEILYGLVKLPLSIVFVFYIIMNGFSILRMISFNVINVVTRVYFESAVRMFLLVGKRVRQFIITKK